MGRLPSFAGVRTRRARQAARRGIVLRDAGITKQTQERYYTAVRSLCKEVDVCTNMEELDESIGDYIERQFQKGAPLNVVADGLSGLHYFLPATRRRLPISWKLFGIWWKCLQEQLHSLLTSAGLWFPVQFNKAISKWLVC